jgi:hypothetical protein
MPGLDPGMQLIMDCRAEPGNDNIEDSASRVLKEFA